jgi:hypothetical protein
VGQASRELSDRLRAVAVEDAVFLRGRTWYWDLKPDYRPGEVFELWPAAAPPGRYVGQDADTPPQEL